MPLCAWITVKGSLGWWNKNQDKNYQKYVKAYEALNKNAHSQNNKCINKPDFPRLLFVIPLTSHKEAVTSVKIHFHSFCSNVPFLIRPYLVKLSTNTATLPWHPPKNTGLFFPCPILTLVGSHHLLLLFIEFMVLVFYLSPFYRK